MTSTLPTFEEFEADCDRKCEVLAQRFAHITPPPDATYVSAWMDEDGQGKVSRHYIVTRCTVAASPAPYRSVKLMVHGMQAADGSTDREVGLHAPDCSFDADGARGLAGALLDAAQHLDGHRWALVDLGELQAALDTFDLHGDDRLPSIARRLIAGNLGQEVTR